MKQDIHPSPRRIDIHCHFFNKHVLTWRLLVDFVQSRIKAPFLAGMDHFEKTFTTTEMKEITEINPSRFLAI